MPDAPQELLSPSEWKVFAVLSRRHPLSFAEVAPELSRHDPDFPLDDNTVRVFLKRLQRKGYLNIQATSGDDLLYQPAVGLDVALRAHAHRFLDQFALDEQEDLETIRQVVEERLSRA